MFLKITQIRNFLFFRKIHFFHKIFLLVSIFRFLRYLIKQVLDFELKVFNSRVFQTTPHTYTTNIDCFLFFSLKMVPQRNKNEMKKRLKKKKLPKIGPLIPLLSSLVSSSVLMILIRPALIIFEIPNFLIYQIEPIFRLIFLSFHFKF